MKESDARRKREGREAIRPGRPSRSYCKIFGSEGAGRPSSYENFDDPAGRPSCSLQNVDSRFASQSKSGRPPFIPWSFLGVVPLRLGL